ncbi:MAG: UMP kinase [Bacteroidales bacterium]|nr:UMP kinase [Bacteroidales bacterium]
MLKYKRILLKLSGEALMGSQSYGIDPQRLEDYTKEVKTAFEAGTEIAIVIGGGNIYRGLQGVNQGMDRVQGDYMGMLATVINSMALQSVFETHGIKTQLLSGMNVHPVTLPMSKRNALEAFVEKRVVIIAGGTGNPFFTTDTAAALRAVETEANAIFKGTRVDGIYSDDPEKNPEAEKYKQISFEEAYRKNLKVMDRTAFTLCWENKLPIVVFDMNEKGNLLKEIKGIQTGTVVND